MQGKHGSVSADFLGKNKNKSTCIKSVKLNGETVTDKEVIANAFNDVLLLLVVNYLHNKQTLLILNLILI